MSIHTDLITVLSSVAGGRVYPKIAPTEAVYPLVNYRIIGKDPTVTIDGRIACVDYDVIFECWASTYAQAIATADSVRAAISSSSLAYSPIQEQGEEFDIQADMFMEPAYFRFLYQ